MLRRVCVCIYMDVHHGVWDCGALADYCFSAGLHWYNWLVLRHVPHLCGFLWIVQFLCWMLAHQLRSHGHGSRPTRPPISRSAKVAPLRSQAQCTGLGPLSDFHGLLSGMGKDQGFSYVFARPEGCRLLLDPHGTATISVFFPNLQWPVVLISRGTNHSILRFPNLKKNLHWIQATGQRWFEVRNILPTTHSKSICLSF